MQVNDLVALGLVFLGGVALAVQSPINGALGAASGSGLFASAVSFGVGFLVLVLALLVTGNAPSGSVIAQLSPWMWTGGLLGAFYVWSVVANVQKLGVVSLVAALVAGQLVAALLIDATGFANVSVQEISWRRLLAVLLVGSGLVLSRY